MLLIKLTVLSWLIFFIFKRLLVSVLKSNDTEIYEWSFGTKYEAIKMICGFWVIVNNILLIANVVWFLFIR